MTTQYQLESQGLPSSTHTEVAILGAMLLDGSAIADATARLEASDFALDSHQRIYRAILHLQEERSAVDLTTVRAELIRRRELDAVGGIAYLSYLTEGIPRHLSVDSYVRIVKDKSRLRQIMGILNSGTTRAGDQTEDAVSLADELRKQLDGVAEDSADADLERVGDYLAQQGEPEAIFENLATVNGIKLGFQGLDEIIGGLLPGDLCIVAARPSMGKTAWACNVAQSLALREYRTVLFALEQKRQAMIRRMLASAARVDYRDIKEGKLRRQDRELLLERRQMLAAAPLYIDDSPGLTTSRIRSKCSRLKNGEGMDIVLVDQLSKVSRADCKQRDFRLQIGEQTAALKLMGQELGVPVVVFNQLGRDTAKRTDPTPRLEDLKESGNIEEDADVVVLLHREEYYDKTNEDLRGKGQMIVAKNREGSLGTVECQYQGRILRWDDSTQPAAEQSGFDQGRW